MHMERIDPTVYVRARAEQLAMAEDLVKFQELYTARGLSFGTEAGTSAVEAYDQFLEPFRKQAYHQLESVVTEANKAARDAYVKVLNDGLSKQGLTGAHDAAEMDEDELAKFNEIIGE